MCQRYYQNRREEYLPGKKLLHTLVVESSNRLTLVDTGIGTSIVENPKSLDPMLRFLLKPKLDPVECCVNQVKELGYSPEDVSDIVLTHLDWDHVSGVSDFPNARIHVYGEELSAVGTVGFFEGQRYKHTDLQGRNIIAYDILKANNVSFDDHNWAIIPDGLDNMCMINLEGHSKGHCGVMIQIGNSYLIHVGDSYFNPTELTKDAKGNYKPCLFQKIAKHNILDVKKTLAKINQAPKHNSEVFCSHSYEEFMRYEKK